MKNLATVIALSLSLLCGCATRPGTPDWVSGTAARYPATQYLIGRGQAGSGEEARDRARADLAKIFEVNIAVESEDVQAFRTAEGGGQYEGRSARRISARTDRIVQGIEIGETWQDPTSKNFHALAVLPRLKAAVALRQEIGQLDDATRVQLNLARDAQDLLLQIAAASQAVALQSERAAHQKTLRIVEPTGQGDEPQWNVERLRADLDALLKRVKLAARVTADTSGGLEPVVKGALAAAGFLADTGDKPDFALEASLSLDDLGRQEGWYWQRGTLEVKLIESASNRVRGAQRWPIKASATARDGALRRALDQADTILKKELRPTIIGFTAGAGT